MTGREDTRDGAHKEGEEIGAEVGRELWGTEYGEYLREVGGGIVWRTPDPGAIMSNSPSDRLTDFPFAMFTGSITSFGCAFLHST